MQRVREVVVRELPGEPVATVAPLGSGLDHAAFLVGDDLVVRVASDDDTDRVRREADLLAMVAPVCPVAVPAPVFVAEGCMAYRLVPGVPLLDAEPGFRAAHAMAVARTLGTVMRELAMLAPGDLVGRDGTSPAQWRDEAERIVAGLGDALPASSRGSVDAFLGSTPPPADDTFVLCHDDLGIEHVLIDPETGRVTGIIDWSDAALADPAKDLGLILRDLGPAALEAALEASRTEATGIRERALFYARCLTLEDLAFGLEHDRPRYVEKSLDALERLFHR